jgi:hypothetical protein
MTAQVSPEIGTCDAGTVRIVFSSDPVRIASQVDVAFWRVAISSFWNRSKPGEKRITTCCD